LNYIPTKKPFAERGNFLGVKILAGKNIEVDVAQKIKCMDRDVARHNELNC
jgi:hypothetical protein